MRLTLRTLLAYMDDVLDPADQEELGHKIESSAFATELIHRSRDAVRRLRLSAPEPLAGDSGEVLDGDHNLDANVAAEYLDNTLSPEGVADFERSCLEAGPHADMLLAEAASCHHVLTMVLGEPAEVESDLRQRLYALAGQYSAAAPAAGVAPTAAVSAPAATPIAPVSSQRSGIDPDEAAVPDYMLAAARARRRSRRLATVSLLFVAALLGGGATWLFWPQGEVEAPKELANAKRAATISPDDLETTVVAPAEPASKTDDVARGASAAAADGSSQAPRFVPSEEVATAPVLPPLSEPVDEEASALELPAMDAATDAAVAAAAGSAATLSENVTDAPLASAAASRDAAIDAAAGDPTVAAAGDAVAGVSVPPTEPGASEAALTPSDVAATAADASAQPPADGAAAPPAVADRTDAAATASAPPVLTLPAMQPPTEPAPSSTIADAGASRPPAEPAPTDVAPAPAAAAPEPPKQLGAYLGNNDMLLRFDPATESWIRLPPRTALGPGDQLLSLPTFRTHVVLGDANAYLSGGTAIVLMAPGAASGDAPSDIAVQIPFGQVILNAGLNGNRIEMQLGDELKLVQLDPSSSLAIEVVRPFEPGSSPAREPAATKVAWYLTSGQARLGGGSEVIAPAMWTTIGGEDSVPETIEKLPAWIDSEPISANERRARDDLAEALVPGEMVNVRLLERTDPAGSGRRAEDRVLAAMSLAYVGNFTPTVQALADVNQRRDWPTLIRSLRQAVARDPAAIEGIRTAMLKQTGDAASADECTEMVLGFDRQSIGATREEVKQGSLVRLVRWLDHEDLIYRVLASYNINQILGTKESFGYKPEQTETQRRISIKRMNDRLQSGELEPKFE